MTSVVTPRWRNILHVDCSLHYNLTSALIVGLQYCMLWFDVVVRSKAVLFFVLMAKSYKDLKEKMVCVVHFQN